jgi:hypothetical protein
MNNDTEKKEFLGWLIVRGASLDVFNTLLAENQKFCKLTIEAVNCLPNEEFTKGKKKIYLDTIMNYTNHKDDGKFKHPKETLVAQSKNVNECIALLWNNKFSPKWAFNYFRGFEKIFQEVISTEKMIFSSEDYTMLESFLETPVLSKDFTDLMKESAEALAQQIIEGNGVRTKIVNALKEDYWISIGRYELPFGIKQGDYLLSNSQFNLLFEANQLILKKIFLQGISFSDLSKELINLCSRISKVKQLELVETLENACNARIKVSNDHQKSKIRALANNTDYFEVQYQIRSKFPSMEIRFK